jgi:hypothetical protein
MYNSEEFGIRRQGADANIGLVHIFKKIYCWVLLAKVKQLETSLANFKTLE